jgi:pantoate--beta-alanine ligase
MKILHTPQNMANFATAQTGTIGFVPTMGNLHAGHASLLKCSVTENDITVLSVFVNAVQFNDTQDYEAYPKTMEQDVALAESLNVDVIFAPCHTDLYPDNFTYQLHETDISHTLEGEHRDGHFTGVLTVIMKLFNIVKPTRAYFGQKDWQQLQLVKGMVNAFWLPTDIVACPTVRDKNGLALSSRNSRLSPEALQKARVLNQLLTTQDTDDTILKTITALGFTTDYVMTKNNRRFIAASIDGVRLIDNVPFKQEPNYVD